VICSVERIIPRAQMRRQPDRVVLPAHRVAAVVLAPGGARPSYVDGVYGRDDEAYRAFDRLSRDPEALKRHVTAWIAGGDA
jgi:glutaconate CoA-transferase subunit A